MARIFAMSVFYADEMGSAPCRPTPLDGELLLSIRIHPMSPLKSSIFGMFPASNSAVGHGLCMYGSTSAWALFGRFAGIVASPLRILRTCVSHRFCNRCRKCLDFLALSHANPNSSSALKQTPRYDAAPGGESL